MKDSLHIHALNCYGRGVDFRDMPSFEAAPAVVDTWSVLTWVRQ